MTWLHGGLLAVLGLVLIVWVWRAILTRTPEGIGPNLRRDAYPDLGDVGLVSVVVPAKDEEADIREALETLLAQDYPHLEVIVVDDRSTDGTAEVVREVAASDPRVRLTRVDSLPEGWFGKPHALQKGAEAARGRWLLFVDADCRQARHSVGAGLGLLVEREADMLSLWPMLRADSAWEAAAQPVAGAILATWFRPSRVNSSRWRTAFANGQYILIRRDAYEAVGGHGAVRRALTEDVALARRVKGAGYRLLNAVSQDLYTTRMYDSLRAMWRGWKRIYAGAFGSVLWLAGVIAMILIFSLLPVVVAIASGGAVAAGAGGWPALALLAVSAAGCLAMAVTLWEGYRLCGLNPWYVLLYPVIMVLVIGFLLSAASQVLGLGSVRWRGTTYRGGGVVEEGEA